MQQHGALRETQAPQREGCGSTQPVAVQPQGTEILCPSPLLRVKTVEVCRLPRGEKLQSCPLRQRGDSEAQA